MAKLSSQKIKMGQMQYEKQRKEHKLQAAKVGFPQDAFSLFCLPYDYGFDLSLRPFSVFSFFFFEEENVIRMLSASCTYFCGNVNFLFFF